MIDSTAPTAAPPVLSLQGLRKQFGQKVAVDDLWLDVPAGSMLGLLGPNGAGKTTTLAMTTGLLRPDAGSAQVLGADVWRDPAAAKGRMGCSPTACGCSTASPAPSCCATPACSAA